MAVPSYLQTYLASYNLSGLDVEKDKQLIITEILNKGDQRAYEWLYKTYSTKEVQEIVKKPIRGMWLESSLRYWLKMFNLKLDQQEFEKSVININ